MVMTYDAAEEISADAFSALKGQALMHSLHPVHFSLLYINDQDTGSR